ncbi:hypothetical protein LCGC14_1134280 [marine sediment metagenome]|uniref:Uncharacterized protein n=1 Tax=marine sediment metagenome TaxID=412755 RepID=A0A0F9Q624_9ZZZZ|nr:hypothetical protein [Candidatus Aminicenantes bacterium]
MHERKYRIMNDQLVKKVGEKPIPDDEPVFIFRAKDRKALAALVVYHMILDNLDYMAEVQKSITDFRRFQKDNPDKMVEPSS